MSCYRQFVMRPDRDMPVPMAGAVGSLSFRCGKCVGCRADRAREWALRCRDEAAMHENSVFLTLTYDDANVPLTLIPADLSGFVKRLRGRIGRFRFFGCGEYGDRFGRPHYHCLLFGATLDRAERLGRETYRSAIVEDCWKMGLHYAGSVTPASAAYCAGYVGKKYGVTSGPREVVDPETGEVIPFQRPFARMSNRPGLGVPYLERYGMELLRGYAVRDGRKVPLPRRYREWLAERYPDRLLELKREQARFAESREWHGSHRTSAMERYHELTRAFFHPE